MMIACKCRKGLATHIGSHDDRQPFPSAFRFNRGFMWRAQDFEENTAAALSAEVVLDLVISEAIRPHGLF